MIWPLAYKSSSVQNQFSELASRISKIFSTSRPRCGRFFALGGRASWELWPRRVLISGKVRRPEQNFGWARIVLPQSFPARCALFQTETVYLAPSVSYLTQYVTWVCNHLWKRCLTAYGNGVLRFFKKVLEINATNNKLLDVTLKVINDEAFTIQSFFLSVTIFKGNGM